MNQSQALDIMKTGVNVFLTGEPGSGKTHTVNSYVSYLRSCGISVAITASTGIAATHIGGVTIHSWSGIGIKSQLSRHEADKIANTKRINKNITAAKVLIIDEISMLLPNTLDMIDMICCRARKNPEPFGGLQVIFVGDFFQLPPIMRSDKSINRQAQLLDQKSAKFAYQSSAWRRANPVICYLQEQHRQDDKQYLSLLSAIRVEQFSDNHLSKLESRKIDHNLVPDDLPKLFTHNIDVDQVNDAKLAKLPGQEVSFAMTGNGPRKLLVVLRKGCLSPEVLKLKVGASVMFTKNNPKGLFVNGTLGMVDRFDPASNCPIVLTREGKRIAVELADWVLEENGEDVARIRQFPLRLAWAITIHKSQGLSLDGAVMDLSKVFEYGQGYVALSRVRRLSGLHLLGWNRRAFEINPEIVVQDQQFRASSCQQFQDLTKMSAEELNDLQQRFINVCGGMMGLMPFKSEKKYQKSKKKMDTCKQTYLLWQEGKSLVDIAAIRQLNQETILSHLKKLVKNGKIKPIEIKRLMSSELIDGLGKIKLAYNKLGSEKLSPIFDYFKGQYSYTDLKLVRLLLDLEG